MPSVGPRGMSSSRSPRPLPCIRTTQLHGDRLWQWAGVWARDEVDGQVPEEPTAGTEHFSLDVKDVLGRRVAVRGFSPSLGRKSDTVEHFVDLVRVAPMVQILDALMPQMVDQLQDITRFFDALLLVPEQFIEVPKILLEDVPVRAVLRDPQLVEQLVEVPTIVSYSLLQLRM